MDTLSVAELEEIPNLTEHKILKYEFIIWLKIYEDFKLILYANRA